MHMPLAQEAGLHMQTSESLSKFDLCTFALYIHAHMKEFNIFYRKVLKVPLGGILLRFLVFITDRSSKSKRVFRICHNLSPMEAWYHPYFPNDVWTLPWFTIYFSLAVTTDRCMDNGLKFVTIYDNPFVLGLGDRLWLINQLLSCNSTSILFLLSITIV